MMTRDELVKNLKDQIDRANEHIDELEHKAQEKSGEARQSYEEKMAQLREMAEPLENLLNKVRASGEERWHQLEADAEKTYKAFTHSYNYFKSQLK